MGQPICLITGATEGVGRATALGLAKKGYRVVVAARSQAKADALRAEIARDAGVDAEVILVDLASLEQVRALANTFCARYARLDVLINNAGVFMSERRETEDGFETSFQVNYLSHFLLTQLLLERLGQSPQGRVINLSSSVHPMGKFDSTALGRAPGFSVLGTYASSKLYMLMFTEELAQRLRGTSITANALHPGIVRTGMMLKAPGAFRVVSWLSLPFSVSPERAASASIHLASAPEVSAVSGGYFDGLERRPPNNRSDTAENRALLWDLSMKAVGLSPATPLRQAR